MIFRMKDLPFKKSETTSIDQEPIFFNQELIKKLCMEELAEIDGLK